MPYVRRRSFRKRRAMPRRRVRRAVVKRRVVRRPRPVRYRKRAVFRRRYGRARMPVRAKVSRLLRIANQNLSCYESRTYNSEFLICSSNGAAARSYYINDRSQTDVAMNALRFYDPAFPTSVRVVDYTLGTYQKKVYFGSTLLSAYIRNNYSTPIMLRVYNIRVVANTNTAYEDLLNQTVPDISNIGSGSSLGIYPGDVKQTNPLYKPKLIKKRILNPGSACWCKVRSRGFVYDNSTLDSIGAQFVKKLNTRLMYFKVEGIIGHTELGGGVVDTMTAQAGVDIRIKSFYKVYYDAGMSSHFIRYVNSDTTSTEAIVALRASERYQYTPGV